MGRAVTALAAALAALVAFAGYQQSVISSISSEHRSLASSYASLLTGYASAAAEVSRLRAQASSLESSLKACERSAEAAHRERDEALRTAAQYAREYAACYQTLSQYQSAFSELSKLREVVFLHKTSGSMPGPKPAPAYSCCQMFSRPEA